MTSKVIEFAQLKNSDLVVDAIYESTHDGQLSGEPVNKLLPGSGNQGGFRMAGRSQNKNGVVLCTTGHDPDWPDTLDLSTGLFIYYCDNKRPGRELHDTRKGGNALLRFAFDRVHSE